MYGENIYYNPKQFSGYAPYGDFDDEKVGIRTAVGIIRSIGESE